MPNPLGSTPGKTAINNYIKATAHNYAPSTREERRRKITLIHKIFTQDIGAPNDPRKWTLDHIRAYLLHIRDDDNISPQTMRKYIGFLDDFLLHYGNKRLLNLKLTKQLKMPKGPEPEPRSLPEEVIEQIHACTLAIEGWRGSVARLITRLYRYTGLRPGEGRTLDFKHVDMANMRIKVSHPKGEQTYGKHRKIPIVPILQETIAEYLEDRRAYLKSNGFTENAKPFIPFIYKQGPQAGKVGTWPPSIFNNLKCEIERLSGVRFQLRNYRTSFLQHTVDNNHTDIIPASKVMGHHSLRTTQKHYGNIRDDSACEAIMRAYSEPVTLENKR